jgi:hypothetical protein
MSNSDAKETFKLMNRKKILAKEVLFVILTLLITLLFYLFGVVKDYRNKHNYETMVSEFKSYDEECDSKLLEFRKNVKVDSLYKLQTKFFRDYEVEILKPSPQSILLGIYSFDYDNYFFWNDIRKSINENTFNQTFSSDYAIERITKSYYSSYTCLWPILVHQAKSHGLWLWNNHINDVKREFKLFALRNNFKRYIPIKSYNQYRLIRIKQKSLLEELFKYENVNYNSSSDYFKFGIIFCFSILFGLRYIIYILKWSIKNLK